MASRTETYYHCHYNDNDGHAVSSQPAGGEDDIAFRTNGSRIYNERVVADLFAVDDGHWTLDTKRGCRIKTVSRVAYELITGRKNPLLHTYIIAHNCMLCEDSSDCGWDCCYSTLCRYQCLISCHRRRPREIILVNRRISRRIRNGGGYARC